MNVRVVAVTQEDLARPCGATMRARFIAETLTAAGAEITTVGWASGAPLVCAGYLAIVPGNRATAKLRAIIRSLRIVRGATHAILTSIGSPYNGFLAWAFRSMGLTVVYDAQDPVMEMLPMLFGRGLTMWFAMRVIALSQRLLDRAVSTTLAAGGRSFIACLRAAGWRGPVFSVFNIHGVVDEPAADKSTVRQRDGWSSSKIVIYPGGLQRWRGLETQMCAVAIARARGADVRMVVSGFFDQVACERYARTLGLGADVFSLEGTVADEAFRALLEACDFAVSSERVPFITASKICDALAHGIRVISVRDGRDINELFGEFFSYYDGTAEDLARVLLRTAGRMDESERARAMERLRSLREESRLNVLRAFGL